MPDSAAHPHGRNIALQGIITVEQTAEYLRRVLDAALSPLEVTGGQYAIMRILQRSYPKAVSRTEIVRQVIEKRADITRQIDGLERKGYVVRERSSKDRRVSNTLMTESGIQALEQMDPLLRQMFSGLGTKLSENEWEILVALCTRITENQPS